MRAAILTALILAGCAPHRAPPADWPQLTITERRLPRAEMQARCAKYVRPYEAPEACAEWDLAARTCTIWLTDELVPNFVVEHERKHCAGWRH